MLHFEHSNNNINEDGAVVTVYFHGTCSNSEDYKNPQYTDQGQIVGETVSTLRKNTQGREVIDFLKSNDSPEGIKHFYIGVDGVGSGDKDHHLRLVPPTKYSTSMQIAFGYGVNENVNHVLEALRQLILRGVKIKNVIFHGWSRGAGSCLTCSSRMYKDMILCHIPVYIISFDAVPGIGNVTEENLYLTANVKHAVIIVAEHEISGGFGGLIPLARSHDTFVQYLISPGGHPTVTYNTGWRYPSTAKKYPDVNIYFPQPGRIFRWMAVNFMMRYGTQFDESFLQTLITKDQLLPLFAEIANDLDKGQYEHLTKECYTVPQQFGSSRKVSKGDNYTNLVLSQVEELHDQRKIKRKKDGHVNSFHTFLLNNQTLNPTEFFNQQRQELLTFEIEDFVNSTLNIGQSIIEQQELSEDIQKLQIELAHTNSEVLNASGLHDDVEKQLIIKYLGEDIFQHIEEELLSKRDEEVIILGSNVKDEENTPVKPILDEQQTLSNESNVEVIFQESVNEADLNSEQKCLPSENIESMNSLKHSQTDNQVQGNTSNKNENEIEVIDKNSVDEYEAEYNDNVTLISHEVLQPDDLQNTIRRDIIDFLMNNKEFFLSVYQQPEQFNKFLKSALGKKHKEGLDSFSQEFLGTVEGDSNLIIDLYISLFPQNEEEKLLNYLKRNISIQKFLASNLRRLETPIADWKIWQKTNANKNNKGKEASAIQRDTVEVEKRGDELSTRDTTTTSRDRRNIATDNLKPKTVRIPQGRNLLLNGMPSNNKPSGEHVLFGGQRRTITQSIPAENELINELDKYIVQRLNETLPRNEPQVTKINLTLNEFEKSKNKARFSNHYHRCLARFFGGHNAYDKISTALKVRTLLELENQKDINLSSYVDTAEEMRKIINSFTSNEIEALGESRLGRCMSEHKTLWPVELKKLIEKNEKIILSIQIKVSK